MSAARSSQWPLLFDWANDIILKAKTTAYPFEWSFGGGTALMHQINHRESHDIDIFLDDPQLLSFLNPQVQGYQISNLPDGYDSDGTHAIKLIYDNVGEIDFICCLAITDSPTSPENVNGHNVLIETPAEIIAKKVRYRGSYLQPRDMFDIAAVCEACGHEYVVEAIRASGADRCEAALNSANAMDPEFAFQVIGRLMYRDHNRHLVEKARSITQDLLQCALSA